MKKLGWYVVMLCCVVVWGCSGSGAAPGTVAYIQGLTANAQNGATVWTGNCAGCHGPEGKGVPNVGSDLTTDQHKAHSAADHIASILNGLNQGKMPSFKGKLTDQQIADVVAYISQVIQKK